MALLTRQLAAASGCDANTLHRMHIAGLVHDVGKIGVPDHVLLKPGPLTDDERAIMQQHAEMGHAILNATNHLRGVADLVHAHHERFDGAGYPRGLAGNGIPLGARIFAVADVFDALTSDRPYRQAMPESDALELIVAESGSHFDPRVVAAFVALLAELDAGIPTGQVPFHEKNSPPGNCKTAPSSGATP